MGILPNLSKIGLLASFVVGIAYEITGVNSLRFVSLVIGTTSLTILSYFVAAKRKIIDRDILHYLKLLK